MFPATCSTHLQGNMLIAQSTSETLSEVSPEDDAWNVNILSIVHSNLTLSYQVYGSVNSLKTLVFSTYKSFHRKKIYLLSFFYYNFTTSSNHFLNFFNNLQLRKSKNNEYVLLFQTVSLVKYRINKLFFSVGTNRYNIRHILFFHI